MLPLPQVIKQHLLVSSLIISGALHCMVIFYSFDDKAEQSSKGEQYTLQLETSKQPTTHIKNDKHTKQSSNIKQPLIQPPTLQAPAKQPEKTAPLNTKATPDKAPTPKAQSKAPSNNIKSNTGENIDMSGKELTAVDRYQKRVLQHILKKIGSAPYFGSASVELTLMRAGIATHIRVNLMNGPSDYQAWLNHKILSANPMPAFPKNMKESHLTLSFPIHHIKEL